MQVPWKHLWNTDSETHRASKKTTFSLTDWCLQAVFEVKFYFQYKHFVNCFLSHLCTQSWSSWCIGPYWNTHISQATWPVYSPIYLLMVHFTYYVYDTSVHAVVPLSTLAPLLMSRAQCQQSQQTPPYSEEPSGSSQPYFPRANPTGQEAAPLPSSQQTLQATTSFPTYEPNF